MIGRPGGPDHDPHPLTGAGLIRLLAAASTAVAIQVSLIDPIVTPVLRHLDLPLVVAATLVLARPTHSAAIALIFGLVVDASGQRLFGLHCVAYSFLGPVARSLPQPVWRHRGPVVAWSVGAQALVVATIVATGATIAAGGLPPGVVGRVLQTALVAGSAAVPVSRMVGLDVSLGPSRAGGGLVARRIAAGLRPGVIRSPEP